MSKTVKTIWQKKQCQLYFTFSKNHNKTPNNTTLNKAKQAKQKFIQPTAQAKKHKRKNCKAKTLDKKLNHQTKRNTIVDYNQKHNNKLQNRNKTTIFYYWKNWKRFSNNGSKPESILIFPHKIIFRIDSKRKFFSRKILSDHRNKHYSWQNTTIK